MTLRYTYKPKELGVYPCVALLALDLTGLEWIHSILRREYPNDMMTEELGKAIKEIREEIPPEAIDVGIRNP
jgi:hypothetical protein